MWAATLALLNAKNNHVNTSELLHFNGNKPDTWYHDQFVFLAGNGGKVFASEAKLHLANPEHVLVKRLAVATTDKLEVSCFSYRREQQLRLTSAAKTPKAASL